MENLLATLRSSLLQHLLQASAGSTRAPAPANHSSATMQPYGNMQPGSTQLSLPPALRQLLSDYAPIHQLLPRIQAVQSTLQQPPQAQLLQTLAAQLSIPGNSIQPGFIKQLVSQWFAFNPAQSLINTPNNASLSSPASWVQSLPPALLWVLLQRIGEGPVQQLLQRVLGQPAAPATAQVNLAFNTLAASILGSASNIRLSQILLADSTTVQQPEYYLVIPYMAGSAHQELELLLKKRARAAGQNNGEYWLFSLRFNTSRFGPLLVKGRFAAHHDNVQPGDSVNSTANAITVRFYTGDELHVAPLNNELEHFTERLQAAGLNGVKAEVFSGKIPDTLAPKPHELLRMNADSGTRAF